MSGVHVIEHAVVGFENDSWSVQKRVMEQDIEYPMKRVVELDLKSMRSVILMIAPSGSHLSGQE